MSTYRVKAYNTAHNAENKIHDDAVARRMGFSGALVPGVQVYAYMMHLPVERWGRAFLERGAAECRFTTPVYDGENADITGTEANDGMEIAVVSREVSCAIGSAFLSSPFKPKEYPVGSPPAHEDRPPASPETLRVGAILCSRPVEVTETFAADYLRDTREADNIYEREKLVHPGTVLRMANFALMHNVKLGPWIHVGSEVQNFGVAHVGETLSARARVAGSYERKGHLFVEMDVLVLSDGARPVAQVRHTAIYRPRQMAAA